MKDFVINALVEYMKFNLHYRIELYVLNNEGLNIPKHVKDRYEHNQPIMLVIRSDQNADPEFSFESRALSWQTTFDRNICRASVLSSSIVGWSDPHNNIAIQILGGTDAHTVQDVGVSNTPTTRKPELKLVSDNKDVKRTERKKDHLSLVVDNEG